MAVIKSVLTFDMCLRATKFQQSLQHAPTSLLKSNVRHSLLCTLCVLLLPCADVTECAGPPPEVANGTFACNTHSCTNFAAVFVTMALQQVLQALPQANAVAEACGVQ